MLTWRVFLFLKGVSVQYVKPALTFEQQADLLILRGLECDRDELICRLQSVSYYRLSGYWYPFREPDHSFREGTKLTSIWRRYTFDRHLRVLVLDAIERIEICLRTELVYRLAHSQGAFGYLDAANMPNLPSEDHADFIDRISQEYERSSEQFIRHFRDTYGDSHQLPPYWMMTELMTFGALFTLFRGAPRGVQKDIAARFDVARPVLVSWLRSLNVVRNVCAHHARLWNRELGVKPKIPKKDSAWKEPVQVPNERIFGILTVLMYMLHDVAPQSNWRGRMDLLLGQYPDIPRRSMGYPPGWDSCPIWSK